MEYLSQAQRDRCVIIDKKRNLVTYLPHTKTRSLKNPEEEIQLEAFLELIYGYGYPPEKLKVSDPVKMGSATKEADIMVYSDRECKSPQIVVECKRRSVGSKAFDAAIDQGFSYAAAVGASFVWVTSGRHEAHFEVWQQQFMEREKNRLPRIPKHKEKAIGWYKLQTKVFRGVGKRVRTLLDNPIFTDTLLYAGTMAFCAVVLSLLFVDFLPQIYKLVERLWEKGMHFGHLYNVIMGLSTFFTLILGGFFMRSHRLFGSPRLNRRLDFVAIALILFLPSWYMSIVNSDPQWWTWAHYKEIDWKSKIYLWPAMKALPLQMAAVYGMIWFATHSTPKKKKTRRKKRK